MPKIIYRDGDDDHCVDADVGSSVMQAAVDNMIPRIDGDCGGQSACATCHVYVDDAWIEKIGVIQNAEEGMLNTVVDRRPSSRLACQISIDGSLDGLVVHLPASQH